MARRLWLVLAFWLVGLALRTPAHAAPSFAPPSESPQQAHGMAHELRVHELRSPLGLHVVHGARARMVVRSYLRAEAAHQSPAIWNDTDEDDDGDEDVNCPDRSGGGTQDGTDEDLGVGGGFAKASRPRALENVPSFEVTLAVGPASGHARIPLHPPRA